MSSITFTARVKTRDYSDQNKQSMNLSEVRMWLVLKGSSYNFRRQKTLGNFIVDFASLKHKLVVEVDGITHEEKQGYDERRQHYITSHGFKILKFVGFIPFPDDVMYEYVWEKIGELERGDNPVLVVNVA